MTDDLVERVIQAAWHSIDSDVLHEEAARNIIALIRNETLEEAARVAENSTFPSSDGMSLPEIAIIRGGKKAAQNIAAAIRAMIKS